MLYCSNAQDNLPETSPFLSTQMNVHLLLTIIYSEFYVQMLDVHCICQKPAYVSAPQIAVLSNFFELLKVLGIYNFSPPSKVGYFGYPETKGYNI